MEKALGSFRSLIPMVPDCLFSSCVRHFGIHSINSHLLLVIVSVEFLTL